MKPSADDYPPTPEGVIDYNIALGKYMNRIPQDFVLDKRARMALIGCQSGEVENLDEDIIKVVSFLNGYAYGTLQRLNRC